VPSAQRMPEPAAPVLDAEEQPAGDHLSWPAAPVDLVSASSSRRPGDPLLADDDRRLGAL
jgi:hypothetical protein